MIRAGKRQLIMDVAIRLFASRGFDSTTVRLIASEAKISKGLIYTYFKGKEDLLHKLIEQYLTIVGKLLNPNDKKEITEVELEGFLDGLRKSIENNNLYWRLYSQLSVKPEILGFFLEHHHTEGALNQNSILLREYFIVRFHDAVTEEFFFSSLIKGFTIQYAFAPELFPQELIDRFIQQVKAMYVLPKPGKGKSLYINSRIFDSIPMDSSGKKHHSMGK